MLKMSRLFKLPNEEALRAMEQLEQMAPPPAEEKPAFDFQAKKLQLNRSWIRRRLLL